MSLINDALKRAGQAQKENPPPASTLEFRAAEESTRRSYTPSAILLAVLLIALALGGVLVGVALQKNPATPNLVNAHQPEVPAAPTPDPGPTDTSTPSEYATALPSATPAAVPPTSANPVPDATVNAAVTNAVAAASVEPPKPIAPKLQGIFYNPAQPSAVVNGKTVYVGNRVGEFEVTKITKEQVTLTSGAQTKVLSLSE